MIRKLADRLVGVDLLDRAVGLLSSQVRYRLQGVEKARVGAQLTLVHILDRNFAGALKVLDETETPGLPAALALQRLHVRARAMMGLKQGEGALAVLKDDKSRDAELLRTEIFWAARNWSKASQSLGNLIRESQAKPGKPLDDTQAAYVLNYVVALTLSGNDRALERARSDFTTAMAAGSLKDAFNLIVAPSSPGLLNPELVKGRVTVAENFQTFMSAYRARLKKENLSDLVPEVERPIAKKAGATEPKAVPDADPTPTGQPAAGQGKPPPQV
ncbi:MAG: hypothetical protein HQ494_07615 [Rhodospirillales bacterium]|nr:hypothetical protein [Rhodospirillales bacterium]